MCHTRQRPGRCISIRAFLSPVMHCSLRGLLLCLSNRSSTSGATKGRDSRAAIFSPDTHNEQTDGENDEDRDNNNAVQNVWELTAAGSCQLARTCTSGCGSASDAAVVNFVEQRKLYIAVDRWTAHQSTSTLHILETASENLLPQDAS